MINKNLGTFCFSLLNDENNLDILIKPSLTHRPFLRNEWILKSSFGATML